MAFNSLNVLKILRNTRILRLSINTSANTHILPDKIKMKPLEFRTENNLTFLEDPDNFGTLTSKIIHKEISENEGDLKEEKHLQSFPLKSQKLTTKQYADIIKDHIKHRRLKEAIDVLELKMLTEDRVQPENYIYNLLIGACADVGYTKKAFKLFNDMKRRALKPTGDTYTCLFTACINSPWPKDGLQRTKHLRELMIEKGIEPNLTIYNTMIKSFGRCGDLSTAFQLVDEMVSKKIKIRVHTFNHLLHACISDKENGLRHALIVWRQMLKMREKPNIFSFNLMLKCVKDCNLGTKEDMQELLEAIEESVCFEISRSSKKLGNNNFAITSSKDTFSNIKLESETALNNKTEKEHLSPSATNTLAKTSSKDPIKVTKLESDKALNNKTTEKDDSSSTTENIELILPEKAMLLEIINRSDMVVPFKEEKRVPNLLSPIPTMQEVLALQEVHTVQDKFAIIGGQEDFFKEMERYGVKPDIKTFTQMLMLLDNSTETEVQLLETMEKAKVKSDINFFNMLIKKRCLRLDYKAALDVKQLIEQENKKRLKGHHLKAKGLLKLNIMTYGIIAMACKTKEDAVTLLDEMHENKLKINIEILGTLLRHGTANNQFGYVLYVLNKVKEEQLQPNTVFVKHLEDFNEKWERFLESNNQKRLEAYKAYSKVYKQWLKDVNIEEALKPIHPWQQFTRNQEETLQRQKSEFRPPKKFYKRKRHVTHYMPRI